MSHRDDYPEDSEVGAPRYGPVIYRNGNAAVNKIVWAIAGTLAVGYLALQAWTTTRLVDSQLDVAQRLSRIEERLGIEP